MELIDVSGYVAEEKMAIAKQYLIPQGLKSTGLKKEQVKYIYNKVINTCILLHK